MGKIILMVPREDMVRQAHNILQEKKYPIDEMRVIDTKNAVMEARLAIAGGATIIIARGLQASVIKKYTDIPVIEIVLTAQEMALLVTRARQIVGKPRPIIAVVGFENMFCDMSFFDELYSIELRTYYVKQDEDLSEMTQRAIDDQVDILIGGDTVVSIAEANHIPSLFLAMTEDSLHNAFSTAEKMVFAMNAEKKTAAQMETILDYSYNGVLQIDGTGIIKTANALMEDLMEKEQEELVGRHVSDILPQMDEGVCDQVLKEGKEYTMFVEYNQLSLFVVAAPVLYEEKVEGAIITCHRMVKKIASSRKEQDKPQTEERQDRFAHILQKSKKMQECVRKARLYALSDFPLVLEGELGTEMHDLAAGIHGNSERAGEAFVNISCAGMSGEEQKELLFGDRGVIYQVHRGTLLIQDAEELSLDNQFRLYQVIQFHNFYGFPGTQSQTIDVRVLLTTQKSLASLAASGKLRAELYYLLSGHELMVPPMRERPEDLRQKIEDALKEYRRKYNRYHMLTNGAKEILYKYPWKGNLIQIESFLDRLVLTADKRSIDENAVKELLKELYSEYVTSPMPATCAAVQSENPFLYSEEAERILQTLRRFGGNREKTAKELGISKATLWRHMKKHGIEI